MTVAELIVVSREFDVVHADRQQLKLLAVQHQRRQPSATGRVATHHQLRMDQRVVFEQLEGQVRFVDQVLGRLVVLQVDHLRLFGAHAGVLLLMHGQLVGRVFADIDNAGVEDQVLALDPHQRAFYDRILVQIEADDLARVLLDRVANLDGLNV